MHFGKITEEPSLSCSAVKIIFVACLRRKEKSNYADVLLKRNHVWDASFNYVNLYRKDIAN